jgi:hypothetical protein
VYSFLFCSFSFDVLYCFPASFISFFFNALRAKGEGGDGGKGGETPFIFLLGLRFGLHCLLFCLALR